MSIAQIYTTVQEHKSTKHFSAYESEARHRKWSLVAAGANVKCKGQCGTARVGDVSGEFKANAQQIKAPGQCRPETRQTRTTYTS